jgi:glycerol-3-phosphate dehydrogenase
VENEWAIHLDDVLLRRSSWHYYHRDSNPLAEQVATWMAGLMQWTPDRRIKEISRYHAATGSPSSTTQFAA